MVPQFPTIASRAARPSSLRRRLIAALACGTLLACGSPLRLVVADDTGAKHGESAAPASGFALEEVTFGWNGVTKVGSWNPVTATVRSAEPVEVVLVTTTADPEGCRVDQPALPVAIGPGSTVRLVGAYRPGRLDVPVRVRIESAQDGHVLAEREFATNVAGPLVPSLPQSVRLVLAVGRPAGLPATATSDIRTLRAVVSGAERQPQCVVHVDDLPGTNALPAAWEAVDVIVLAGEAAPSEAAAARLAEWVRGGGHVVVAVGRHSEALRSGPLAKWLPIVPKTGEPLGIRELSGLEYFVSQSRRVEIFDTVPMARLEIREGDVLLSGVDGPLLARAPYGFGRATVLAVDADVPPLSEWEPLPEFWRRVIVGRRKIGTTTRRTDRGSLGHSGISDLASQVHAIQERFDDLPRPSLWTVLGWTLAYLALIGPLDWFLVHRGLRRPQWTWATFPLFVVLASLAAVVTARASNGSRDLVNSLEILDVDVAGGLQRTRQWDTVFGAGNRRYAVDWVRDAGDGKPAPSAASEPTAVEGRPAAAPDATVTWSAVPENVFGGMYRAGGFELGRPGYRCGPLSRSIENLPVPVWSTRSLVADDLRDAAPVVESRLEVDQSGALVGSIVQRLGAPIDDWLIAFGTRVYVSSRIGAVREKGAEVPAGDGPGSSDPIVSGVPKILPAPNVLQRDLAGFLAGTVAVERRRKENQQESEIVYEQTPYDPLSRDPAYVVRMLTFHEVVEGREYTGLSNDALRRWEMSHLLADGRAVLFGRLERPAGTLRLDGAAVEPARRDTFVRIVLPVRRIAAGPTTDRGSPEPDRPE